MSCAGSRVAMLAFRNLIPLTSLRRNLRNTEFKMLTTPAQTDPPRTLERNLRDTGRGLVTWITCSMFLILFYALAFWSNGFGRIVSIFSHGALIAVAFVSIGSLIGFLFGIPK